MTHAQVLEQLRDKSAHAFGVDDPLVAVGAPERAALAACIDALRKARASVRAALDTTPTKALRQMHSDALAALDAVLGRDGQ